jgi:hypothetical protein
MAKKLTSADIEALQASWAWKVATPVFKLQREIQRVRRRWEKRWTSEALEPSDEDVLSAPPVEGAVSEISPPDVVKQPKRTPVPAAPSQSPAASVGSSPEVAGQPGAKRVSAAPSPAPAERVNAASDVRTPDHAALKAAYDASPMASEPDTFVLYRILGNDLEPRHRKGQTRSSLGLILAHEQAFEDCEKRWVLNRIVDRDEENRIIDLLERSGQSYVRIPFDLEAYGRVGWETRGFAEDGFFLSESFSELSEALKARAEVHARTLKNLYVMNNNGGRNAALDDGRSRAKWVLPFDGNCFLTPSAWAELTEAVKAQPYLKYFTVPMLRVARNEDILLDQTRRSPADEPQIIFRRDAIERFDEAFPYGRRPKVEMLVRLGVPGPWDGWSFDPWDLPSPQLSQEAGQFATAGWVGRLESGRPDLEAVNGAAQRVLWRSAAIVSALDALDARAIAARYRPQALALYDEDRVRPVGKLTSSDLAVALRADAEAALSRGPYSVVDKPVAAPSGDLHDYLSLARYWWPDPQAPDGLPYQLRDGVDVIESGLPGLAAEQFDRLRIQALSDDVVVLALAGTAFGEASYFDHAARLLRVWFLDPRTRMAPHLRFAQVRRGHNGDEGSGSGVLDLACIVPLLDGVRLVEEAGALDESEGRAFRNWLTAYLEWLKASPQGRHACQAKNNHGTFFDLQVLAIAAYLGDGGELARTLRRARERVPHQFASDGSQPLELARTRPRHYSHYNLIAWTLLARVAEAVGDDLWSHRTKDGRGIERGLAWVINPHGPQAGPQFADEPNVTPLAPLALAYRTRYAGPDQARGSDETAPFCLGPRSGMPPYWSLLR